MIGFLALITTGIGLLAYTQTQSRTMRSRITHMMELVDDDFRRIYLSVMYHRDTKSFGRDWNKLNDTDKLQRWGGCYNALFGWGGEMFIFYSLIILIPFAAFATLWILRRVHH